MFEYSVWFIECDEGAADMLGFAGGCILLADIGVEGVLVRWWKTMGVWQYSVSDIEQYLV